MNKISGAVHVGLSFSVSTSAMRRRRLTGFLIPIVAAVAAPPAFAGLPTEVMTVAGFGQVAIYAPAATPSDVVLFISGDGGWNLGVIPMAEALRDRGALVAGIDIRAFMKSLNASTGCAYPSGALEDLSRAVQLHRKLPAYKPPILVGYSSGATLVYAALAAAPAESFAGAISLGFCPDLEIARPPCQQGGLVAMRRPKGIGFDLAPNKRLQTPWMVLQGNIDQVCAPATTRAFVAAIPTARLFYLEQVGHGFAVPRRWEAQFLEAYKAIASSRLRTPASASAPAVGSAPAIEDLGLTEVPAVSSARTDTMAVILTGDGGWADLDKSLAGGMAERGIAAVGWSSLRYYWTPRTPDEAAADLARIVRHFIARWNVNRVILVGYSFGADVLPFLVNRLPADVSAHVRAAVLLGPSDTAAFEFHVSDWLRRVRNASFPTVPEIQRLGVPVVCVRGADEADSPCRNLNGPHIKVLDVGHGHHFSGDYSELVNVIVNAASERWVNAARRQPRA
jgi:type IV secretory pathway VirJ component